MEVRSPQLAHWHTSESPPTLVCATLWTGVEAEADSCCDGDMFAWWGLPSAAAEAALPSADIAELVVWQQWWKVD